MRNRILIAFPASLVFTLCARAEIAHTAQPSVERGEYIARAADCLSCHTLQGKPPYSGGTELKTKFGSLFGPNITPDASTGIGAWTRDDFDRAVRRGIRKDGAYLYPGMPFVNYSKMSDADLNDLWAYMRTIPPVSNTAPANTLIFPMSLRASAAVWQGLFFKPARFASNAEKGAEWNRGAYLVEALGHCDACHSPRNVLQAPERSRYLTGAQVENWYAPDIGSDPLSSVGKWNVDELAGFLKTGRGPGNKKTFGPMQAVIHNSLSFLTAADLRSIAIFLKDQPARPEPPAKHRATFDQEQASTGATVYADHCGACHGDRGQGVKSVVPALAGNSAIIAGDAQNVVSAVLQGFAPQGTWSAMGSFKDVLSDEEIASVANYVRSSWGNTAKSNVTAVVVERLRAQVPASSSAQSVALLCPNLPARLLKPALEMGSRPLLDAAENPNKLQRLVDAYDRANPRAKSGEKIQALSTAYCRALAQTHDSPAQASGKIARFSQRVAVALTR